MIKTNEGHMKREIGDLIKIIDNENLGIVLKEHQKAGIPFYLIYDTKTEKQTWFPYYSLANPVKLPGTS